MLLRVSAVGEKSHILTSRLKKLPQGVVWSWVIQESPEMCLHYGLTPSKQVSAQPTLATRHCRWKSEDVKSGAYISREGMSSVWQREMTEGQ